MLIALLVLCLLLVFYLQGQYRYTFDLWIFGVPLNYMYVRGIQAHKHFPNLYITMWKDIIIHILD